MKQAHICYLCFSAETSLIGRNIDFDTDVYVCNDCGLIQNDFVSSLYLNQYYHNKYRESRKEKINDKYIQFMSLRADSQFKFIKNNVPDFNQIHNVLDIGASAGELLKKFIPTAKIFAVESDLDMIAHLKKFVEIEVIDETVLFGPEYYGKFDLIMLSHVFEHINNPLEFLYKLYKILSVNGYVFLEVPNEPVHLVAHNIKIKKKGVGHLFDYTVDTLRQMIDKSSLFEVELLSTYSVSVNDYIKGASIRNFEQNKCGDGIHMRCILKKKENLHF